MRAERVEQEVTLTGGGQQLITRADELTAFSEEEGALTRTFLTPQHRAAGERVIRWMRAAGMMADFDAIGNVVGRYEGTRPNLPLLLLGSHLDTVRNAGRYDGILGVLTAVACVAELNARGERLPFAIEVIGFGDEEGVRFQATLIGSRAVAGTFDPALLARRDAQGVTLAEAMRAFGLDPARIGTLARRRQEVLAYVELHIEQGPVLEAEGLPVGVVTSIAGATRATVELIGEAGHAGTVPMTLRRDALAAAAEVVLAVEQYCAQHAGLVGTVGQLSALPGAVNVIPARVCLSLDIRAAEDAQREAAVAELFTAIEAIGRRRRITVSISKTHDSPSTRCASWLIEQLERAILAHDIPSRRLSSGAGHDAMAMAALTDVGMLFVRCKGGISHNPAESITAQDAEIGARVLLDFIRNFQPMGAPAR